MRVGPDLLPLLASRPASASRFDSFEPFCTSHIVAPMNSANWRNSDCQFSITAPPKSGDRTYPHQETTRSPCSPASAFVAADPRTTGRSSAPRNIAAEEERQPVLARERLILA